MKHIFLKSYTLKDNKGFTLIELLVVVFIITTLTSIVVYNFMAQRVQQETQAAAQDLISKVREVQSAILAGREVSAGLAPDAYEIVFATGRDNYDIYYVIVDEETGTDLERVQFENVQITQNITLASGATIRLESPFGKIKINDQPNQSADIILRHRTGKDIIVEINGISGKIGTK